MNLRENIINTTCLLLDMLDSYGDVELAEYIANAIWYNDITSLYDLEDALEE